MAKKHESFFEELVSEAIRDGGNAFELEYDNGYDEVCVMRGPVGWGIARLRSSSREAIALREELRRVARRKRHITVDGHRYEVIGRVGDSFGEATFRVEFRRA
jgi:hypothetical protein